MEVGLVLISSTSTSRCAKVNKLFLVLIIPNMTHIAGFTKAWMVNQIDKNQATLTDLFIYAGLAATPKVRSQTVCFLLIFPCVRPSWFVVCMFACVLVDACVDIQTVCFVVDCFLCPSVLDCCLYVCMCVGGCMRGY